MLDCLLKPVSKPWKSRVPSHWIDGDDDDVDDNDDDDDDAFDCNGNDAFDCNIDDVKDDGIL